MHRSIIPFILICLGFTVVGLARDLPLFDWETVDIPPNLPVNPLTTRLGESVSKVCNPVDLNSVAGLSQHDESLEWLSFNVYQKVFPWLWSLSWLLLFLSGIYIWWFAIWYKHPISEAIIFTVLIIVMFCWLLINVWHPLSARVAVSFSCPSTFNARLLRVHYEMLVVLFTGIGLELGAVVMILRQIMRAIMQRKESAQSAVG
jgi:hypothetical protein